MFGSASDEAEIIGQFDVLHVSRATVNPETGEVIAIRATQAASATGDTAESVRKIEDVSPPR